MTWLLLSILANFSWLTIQDKVEIYQNIHIEYNNSNKVSWNTNFIGWKFESINLYISTKAQKSNEIYIIKHEVGHYVCVEYKNDYSEICADKIW